METATKPQSLMDLMTMGTDDIAVLTSRLPAEGVFIVRGTNVKRDGMEAKSAEQDDMVKIVTQTEILQAWPLDKTLNANELAGKNISDVTMYTAETYKERIGLVKGNYKKIGLPFAGEMGGTPEKKGWLDGVIGYPFQLRVRHVTNKNTGADMAFIDWSRIDPEHEKAVFDALGIPVPTEPAKAA